MTTTVTGGPAFIVPATLAPELAQALALMRRRYVTDAIEWPAELADLEGKTRSVVAVMQDRAFPTGRPNDLAKREMCPEMPGNRETLSAEDVGARLNLSGRRVRQLVRGGQLSGSVVGGAWRFKDDDIAQYEKRKRAN